MLPEIGQSTPAPGDWQCCGDDVAVPHWNQVQRQGILNRLTAAKRLILYQLAVAEAYLDCRWEEAAYLRAACSCIAKSTGKPRNAPLVVAYEGIASQLTGLGVPSDPPHPFPQGLRSVELQ